MLQTYAGTSHCNHLSYCNFLPEYPTLLNFPDKAHSCEEDLCAKE